MQISKHGYVVGWDGRVASCNSLRFTPHHGVFSCKCELRQARVGSQSSLVPVVSFQHLCIAARETQSMTGIDTAWELGLRRFMHRQSNSPKAINSF